MVKSIRSLTISSYIAMLFLGVANSLIASAARQLGLAPAQIGLIIACQNLGFAIGVIVTGNLADTYSKTRLLVAGSLILGVALLAFYRTPVFWVNCLVMLCVGIGIGVYEGVTDAMLIDLHPGFASRYINLNHFWVSVGKVTLAIYLMFLVLNWRAAVNQSGIAVLLLAGFFAVAYLPPRGAARGDLVSRVRSLLRERTFAVFFGATALAVGIEAAASGIMTTFLAGLRGFTAWQAQVGLILFLTAIGLGRLLAGLLTKSEHAMGYTLALFAVGIPLYASLFFLKLGAATWLAIFAAGLAISACLPLVLSLGGIHYPSLAGTVLGALKVGIPVGGIVMPFVMSVLITATGLQPAMVIFPLAFLLGLVLLLAGGQLVAARDAAVASEAG